MGIFDDAAQLREDELRDSLRGPAYEKLNRLMHDFNSILRHKIGRRAYSVSFRGSRSFPTLECDEGGWVNIDKLLESDFFWQPAHSNQTGRDNPEEKRNRLQMLMKANCVVGMKTGRYRLQFLGIKVCPLAAHLTSGEPWSHAPVSIDTQIAENQYYDETDYEKEVYMMEDAWIRPWAVRATSGHSVDRQSVVKLDPNKIAYHPTIQAMNDLGGGFHSTSIRNIHGIINEGILPGGPYGSRVSTHFGVFAPWDDRNLVSKCRVAGDPTMPLLVIYVPSYVLLQYGATLTDSGVILVSRAIPFEQVRDAWVAVPQRDHRWKFATVRKILSMSLEQEIVETINGTYDPQGQYFEPTPARVRDTLLGLNPGPHVTERDQLIAELDSGVRSNSLKRRCVSMCGRLYSSVAPMQNGQRDPLRLRVCPQCMYETPSRLAICHHCLAFFDCIGRKVHFQTQDAVVVEDDDIDAEAVQRAQEATGAVIGAADAETVSEPEGADVDDTATVAEPDEEAIAADDQIAEEYERLDAPVNDDEQLEASVDDRLRGVLNINQDMSIVVLQARSIDALTVKLRDGTGFVAQYDSSQMAAQYMDVIFCGMVYDFWQAFDRMMRLPYPDLHARFQTGSRNDALGQWPVVELDESTGLPRDLTGQEIIADTRNEELRAWRPRRFRMHQMMAKAVRGAMAMGFDRQEFNIKGRTPETVRPIMHVMMTRLLASVFGVKAYSYFRRAMPHVPGYLHIDPSAMISAQHIKGVLSETIELVHHHGFMLPPDANAKYMAHLNEPWRRPASDKKILPIEYQVREPTAEQNAEASQARVRETGRSSRTPAPYRPWHRPRSDWPDRQQRGQWDRAQ